MTPTDPPKARKRPRQSRSLMLVKAIQEACLQILDQEGPDQLSTQRIADVAGINIASLYQYYPNKEAVLTDVFEELILNYTQVARDRFIEIDRLSRKTLEGTLKAIVEMEIEHRRLLHHMNSEFYRVYQHSFDVHQRVNELTISLDNPSWEHWFPQFLSYHREKLRSQDLDALSRMARHSLEGTLLTTLAENPEQLDEDAFKDELLTLLLNYLRA